MLSLFRDELNLREERGAMDTYNAHTFNICVQRIKNGAEKDALTEYAERTFSKEEGKRFFQFLRQSNVQKNKAAVREKYFLGMDEKGKKIVLLVSLKASTLDGEGKVLVSVRRLWNESAASFIAGKMGEGL